MNTAELIQMTFRHFMKKTALPFDKTPNIETIQAFEEAKNHTKTSKYNNTKEALADMWDES